MNPIERLHSILVGRFPDIAITLDPPSGGVPGDPWFLDIHRPGNLPPIVVEWRPDRPDDPERVDRGFGISTPGPEDFGCGPEEVHRELMPAFNRIVRLVMEGDQGGQVRVTVVAAATITSSQQEIGP